MQISKREFLKRLGLGGAGLVGGAALADEFVATSKTLPPARQSAQVARGVSGMKMVVQNAEV